MVALVSLPRARCVGVDHEALNLLSAFSIMGLRNCRIWTSESSWCTLHSRLNKRA